MIETDWTQEGLTEKAVVLSSYLTGKQVALGNWSSGVFTEVAYSGYARQTLTTSVATASDGNPLVIGAVQFAGPSSGGPASVGVLAVLNGSGQVLGTATITPMQSLPVGSVQRFNLTFRP